MQLSMKQLVTWKVQFFVGVAELLLLLRVALRFFNGDPNAQFIHWAYASTNTLLEPFRAVFTSVGTVNRGWVVDYVALFAIAVYGAAGILLLGIMDRWGKKR